MLEDAGGELCYSPLPAMGGVVPYSHEDWRVSSSRRFLHCTPTPTPLPCNIHVGTVVTFIATENLLEDTDGLRRPP